MTDRATKLIDMVLSHEGAKTTKTCKSSYNVLFTSFGNGGFLEKLLSFIYDLIQQFTKKG